MVKLGVMSSKAAGRDMSCVILEFCPALAELVRSSKVVGKSGPTLVPQGTVSTVNNLHTIHELMHQTEPLARSRSD